MFDLKHINKDEMDKRMKKIEIEDGEELERDRSNHF